MAVVQMSDLAYKEFKAFLDENKVESNVIRIYLMGMGWGGPTFNIALDEQKIEDVVEKIDEITFLVDGKLFKEHGGFIVKCGEENGLGGFSIEPINKPEGGGCASCSSCG